MESSYPPSSIIFQGQKKFVSFDSAHQPIGGVFVDLTFVEHSRHLSSSSEFINEASIIQEQQNKGITMAEKSKIIELIFVDAENKSEAPRIYIIANNLSLYLLEEERVKYKKILALAAPAALQQAETKNCDSDYSDNDSRSRQNSDTLSNGEVIIIDKNETKNDNVTNALVGKINISIAPVIIPTTTSSPALSPRDLRSLLIQALIDGLQIELISSNNSPPNKSTTGSSGDNEINQKTHENVELSSTTTSNKSSFLMTLFNYDDERNQLIKTFNVFCKNNEPPEFLTPFALPSS